MRTHRFPELAMTHRFIPTFAALAFAAFAASAMAQQTAPAPSAAPVPKHDCVKPGEFPGNLASVAKVVLSGRERRIGAEPGAAA